MCEMETIDSTKSEQDSFFFENRSQVGISENEPCSRLPAHLARESVAQSRPRASGSHPPLRSRPSCAQSLASAMQRKRGDQKVEHKVTILLEKAEK